MTTLAKYNEIMTRAIKARTTVQPGGRIQIASSELNPGATVEVIVLQGDETPSPSIDEILADYPGGRLFKTADEVDAYIRAERDAWDR